MLEMFYCFSEGDQCQVVSINILTTRSPSSQGDDIAHLLSPGSAVKITLFPIAAYAAQGLYFLVAAKGCTL